MKTRMVRLALVGLLCSVTVARAFGPTVIMGNMDPAEIAHRASQITQLASQVQQATQMVRHANTLVQFAGDPKAAVRNLGDLGRITEGLGGLLDTNAFDGLTAQFQAGQQLQDSATLLNNAFGDLQGEIEVFGKKTGASPDVYQALYSAQALANEARKHIKKETDARKKVADELADTYNKLRAAQSESEKQALAAKIALLNAQQAAIAAAGAAARADAELKAKMDGQKAMADAETKDAAEAAVLAAAARQRQAESDARLAATLETTANVPKFNYSVISSNWGVPTSTTKTPPTPAPAPGT